MLFIRNVLLHVAILIVLSIASGCASVPEIQRPVIPEGDRFVPVNYFFDTSDYSTVNEAKSAQYLTESLLKSGRFVQLDRGIARWPHTLQIKYKRLNSESPVETAGFLLSAATLFVVPTKVTHKYVLSIELFAGNVLLKKFTYEEEMASIVSIFKDPLKDDYESIERLLSKFYADLDASNLLPRAKDVMKQQEPRKMGI